MIRKILWAVLAGVLALAAAVAINTVRKGSRQLTVAPLPPIAIADILPDDAVITHGTQDYALAKSG